MNSKNLAQKAALISLFVSTLVMGIKFFAYGMTKSLAVFSDATESIVNVLTASIALWVIRFSLAPADREHPYGHGKAENFSAVIEGAMVTFAGVIISIDAVKALIKGPEIRAMDFGFLIVVGAALINLFLGLYLKHMGNKENSEALKASGAHVMSDVWTTAGVLVALALVHFTGIKIIDPLVATFIGGALVYSGSRIIRTSISALLDAIDEEALKKIQKSFSEMRITGIIDIHHVKTIRSGNFHHIDAHLVVPGYWEIEKAHNLAHDFEDQVVKSYGTSGEIAFHLDPCKRAYCSSCDVFNCPIRVSEFKELREFTLDSLTDGPRPDSYESKS